MGVAGETRMPEVTNGGRADGAISGTVLPQSGYYIFLRKSYHEIQNAISL